jgi:hypothetical protein
MNCEHLLCASEKGHTRAQVPPPPWGAIPSQEVELSQPSWSGGQCRALSWCWAVPIPTPNSNHAGLEPTLSSPTIATGRTFLPRTGSDSGSLRLQSGCLMTPHLRYHPQLHLSCSTFCLCPLTRPHMHCTRPASFGSINSATSCPSTRTLACQPPRSCWPRSQLTLLGRCWARLFTLAVQRMRMALCQFRPFTYYACGGQCSQQSRLCAALRFGSRVILCRGVSPASASAHEF